MTHLKPYQRAMLLVSSGLFVLQFIPSFTLFKFGYFRQIDPSYGGLLIIAGLIGMILFKKVQRVSLLQDPLVQNFWMFALITILCSVVHPYPLRNVFGTAQIYDGLLLFLAAGLLVFGIRQIIQDSKLEGIFLWSCYVIGLLYCLLIILTEKDSSFLLTKDWFYKPFVFNDFFGFIALAFIPISERLIQKYKNRSVTLFTVVSTLALLFYSTNWTLYIALSIGIGFVMFWHFAHFKWLYRFRYIIFPLGVLLIAVAVISYLKIIKLFNIDPSVTLTSRFRLFYVTIAHYYYNFSWDYIPYIVFGNGWDSYQQFASSNLYLIEGLSNYQNGDLKIDWEYASRDLINSHNTLFEFFTSLGVVGAIAYLYTQYRLLIIANFKLKSCQIYIVALSVLTSGWYQFVNMLPFTLVALVLCTKDQPLFSIKELSEKAKKYLIIIMSALLIVGGVVFLTISTGMNRLIRHVDQAKIPALVHDFLSSPYLAFDAHLRSMYHSRASEYFCEIIYNFFKERDNHMVDKKPLGEFNNENGERILGAMLEIGQDITRSKRHDNIVSLFTVLRLYDSLYVRKDFLEFIKDSPYRAQLEDTYHEIVTTLIERHPLRADMSQSYLGYLFESGQHLKLSKMIDLFEKQYPDHPVKDYFKGLNLLSSDQKHDRTDGINLLKKSVQNGVGRYMPIDNTFLNVLNAKQ